MSQLLFQFAKRACRKLFSAVGLICVTATTIFSQQAQTIKTEHPVDCDGKNYQLRLVAATTIIGAMDASALAIVLTPDGEQQSKVFGVYWVNNKPAYHDHTSGEWEPPLLHYGKGLTTSGKPVVEAFFSTVKCSESDPQVIGLTRVMDPQSLRTAANLRAVVEQLKTYGVQVNPDEIREDSGATLDLFRNRSNEVGFASAIRLYVTNLLAEEGRKDAVGYNNPTAQDEIARLESQNKQLNEQKRTLEMEKEAFLGAAPRWLTIAFPFMSVLSVGGLALIGLAAYQFIRPRTTPNNGFVGTSSNYKAKTEGDPPAADRVEAMIASARERRQKIEKTYASLELEITQNQKAKAPDVLADTILQRLQLDLSGRERKRSKQIIEQALTSITTVATECRKHAKDLDDAYGDLQSQLEALVINPTPTTQTDPATNGKPGSSTPAEQEINSKLADLVATCNEIKGSVEKFDLNVEQRFESNRALHDIWFRLYSKPYPRQLPSHFADEVGEVIQLYQMLNARFGRDGDSVSETMNAVRQTLNTLESIRQTYLATSIGENARAQEIVARIRIRLEQDVETVRDVNSIQQLLSQHFGRNVKVKESVAHLLEEHSTAQQKLRKYHAAGNLLQNVEAVVSNYETILRDTDDIFRGQTDSIHERVNSLVHEYRSLKSEADRAQAFEAKSKNLQAQLDNVSSEIQAAETLVDEITLQLNFKTDPQKQSDQHRITTTLNRLKTESNSSPYLQLRMGLSSAMIAIEKAINTNTSAEHEDLIEALFLNNVKNSLKELLGKIEECSGDQLWTDALYEAFNDQWLHYLIRADLLLRTYYSGHREFSSLRKAVSLACTSILAALHDFQVEVVEVELFEKLPTNMETEAVLPGLRNLPAVVDKVGLMVQNIKAGDVVVDVTSFPVVVRGVQENRGRASIANPSAWLQQ